MSGEKRSQECEDTMREETAIIVDIEGTTTSISFVKETLFPYVREHLKEYIEKNWEVEEFKGDLEKLKEQAKKDETDKVEGVVSIAGATPEEEKESILKNVLWQMDGDRKSGALKQLQGHMWREAYKSGAVKGHVYEDVPKAFDTWTKAGRKVYVYSSGSVEAQKLLFAHSEHGDMLKYFSDYFDTEVGPKQEAASYKNILAKIDFEPSNVLFLTDIVKEAEAAKEAGMSATIVIRQGNGPLTDEEKVKFTTIESFMDLSFQTSAKRQKVEKKSDEKLSTEPVVGSSEPMDTSEDAEPVIEKPVEKIEEEKSAAVTEKIEETKMPEKPEESSMETDSKIETEKKPEEVSVEETKKNEAESKTSEKMEVASETIACENSKKESESVKSDTEITKKDLDEKAESEIEKKQIEAPKSDNDATKKICEVKKSDSETPKKDNETTKTEVEKKLENSEKMDEVVTDLPSKSEPIVKKTEEKTEVTKKVSDEIIAAESKKTETEIKKIVETVPEDKNPKEISNASSVPIDNAKLSVETKTEEKVLSEEKKVVAVVEKVETEVVKDATEKSSVKIEEKSSTAEQVKQNGESSLPPKSDEAKVEKVEKSESNGETKEETTKVEQVEAKVPVAEEPEKKIEPTGEVAKKDEAENEKTKADETASVETTDAKLNGNAQNGEKSVTEEKPHRNGLNGESSNEKTNGNTKEDEASAQNGETDTKNESSAESSIKVKKVVDSTNAEGAGEPEVVPPVAVAATS